MPIDRRRLMGLMALSLLAPSACAQTPTALPAAWQDYRRRFMAQDGRILDTGNRGVSHSEGQGFALMLALGAGDREGFEALFNWTERTLKRDDSGLYAWRFDPAQTPQVADPNNATDGDILIAWALMQAAKRWNRPAYDARSLELREAILAEAVVEFGGHRLLLPGRIGFVQDEAVVINPSYYIWPALDAFAAQDARWAQVLRDGMNLIQASSFGPWRLPSDWVQVDAAGLAAPAKDRPARFGFDAIRVPLYLAWAGRTAPLAPFTRYFTETQKADGWPAWIDVVSGETAPYPLSPGGQAVAHLVLGKALNTASSDQDYYSHSLSLLAAEAKA